MKKASFSILTLLLLSLSLTFAQNREVRKVDSFTRIAFRAPGKLLLRQGSPQKVEMEGSQDILKEIETRVEGGRLIIGKEDWRDWNWGNEDRITVYITVPNIDGLSVSGSGDLVAETKFTVSDLKLNVSGSGSLEIQADASGDVDADVSGSGRIVLSGKCRSFDSHVSGSGRVKLSESILETASFGVSGSGKIEASGTAREARTSISGSGKLLAADLEVDKCEVRISGSGDVEINVKSALDANISGSGSVSYRGNPSHVNSHSSGSGHVRKL